MQHRFGIIGFGWVARDYMYPAILASERADLVAASSLGTNDLRSLPDSVGRYQDWQSMLQREELDAIYVATPNYVHCEQTVKSLQRGLHVLCEKPMTTTAERARLMIEVAANNERTYATAFDQRFHPAHRLMREWIAAGRLGIVTQVRTDYACWLDREWADSNWRIEAKKAGGGAIIDLAPHGLDLLEFLLQQRVSELAIYAQHAVQTYGVDDGGTLMVRFGDAVLGTMHVGYNRPETLPRRRLEIIGTRGRLLAQNTMGQTAGGTLTFTDAETGDEVPLSFDERVSPFAQQLEHFMDTIEGKRTPERLPTDDVRLVQVLERALRVANRRSRRFQTARKSPAPAGLL